MVSTCLEQSANEGALFLRLDHAELPVIMPPAAECEVCVIVPVRDEAELLESCLSALLHQIDRRGQRLDPKRYEVIVLANNCRDDSAAIAHRFSQQHPELRLHVIERTFSPAKAYIGRMRQLLMDRAYSRLVSLHRKGGIIASTDGDTRVAPNWVTAIQDEVARGADGIGGQIMSDRTSLATLHPQVRWRYWRNVYYHHLKVKLESYLDADPFDQWPRHQQHYGANLAVTAEMYAKVGGMPAVRTPEDVAFYQALGRMNARFRHSPRVRVTTSARQVGRTNIGFANQLAQWAGMGQQALLVEPLGAIETRCRMRRQIRDLWQRALNSHQITITDVNSVANIMGIPNHWLRDELKQAQTFEGFFERIEQRQQQEGIWQSRWALVDLEDAIASLRRRTYVLYREPPQKQSPWPALNGLDGTPGYGERTA